MVKKLTCLMTGICMGLLLFGVGSFAAEPAEVEKFVKARIEIGEMMTNYFSGGRGYGEGQRPSPEAMREMGADINTKLSALLSKHDLTIEEYRQRSPEIFADDEAVQHFLNKHPELKERYSALPLGSMRGGSTGRGY